MTQKAEQIAPLFRPKTLLTAALRIATTPTWALALLSPDKPDRVIGSGL